MTIQIFLGIHGTYHCSIIVANRGHYAKCLIQVISVQYRVVQLIPKLFLSYLDLDFAESALK